MASICLNYVGELCSDTEVNKPTDSLNQFEFEFEFEPKGSEISSSWRRVRINLVRANEPSSTVVETISPKSNHCSCNIRAINLSLSKMHTKEKCCTLCLII